MWLSLFVIGTLWFWLLLAAAAVVMAVCVAREAFGRATLTLVATLAVLTLFGDFNVLSWLRHHSVSFLIYLSVYLAAGTAWSVAKWWFFVRNLRAGYDEGKLRFLRENKVDGTAIPAELREGWRRNAHRYMPDRLGRLAPDISEGVVPRARDYKGKIMSWMIYWPLSLIGTLIDDPIRKLFQAIFNAIQGAFQRISDRAFKGVEDDFRDEPGAQPPPTGGNGAENDERPHRGPGGVRTAI